MSTTANDVELVLRLYELRREPEMRKARAWYLAEFDPQSGRDVADLMLAGFDASAKFRMVTTYWEMAASFVNNRGIDEKMFMDANTEHIAVLAKIEPFLSEIRELFLDPEYLVQLERLVMKVPDAREVLAKRRKLLARWTRKKEADGAEELNT